jgi:hypothetical protein
MYIRDKKTNELVECEIRVAKKNELPVKKDGWSFNWNLAFKSKNSQIYILSTTSEVQQVQGALQLVQYDGMVIMELLEVHPNNRGSRSKKYDYVARCLIAFACSETFLNEGNYRGFLTFTSKTELMNMYKTKYGAVQTIGNRMYIDPDQGMKLMNQYLDDKIDKK